MIQNTLKLVYLFVIQETYNILKEVKIESLIIICLTEVEKQILVLY